MIQKFNDWKIMRKSIDISLTNKDYLRSCVLGRVTEIWVKNKPFFSLNYESFSPSKDGLVLQDQQHHYCWSYSRIWQLVTASSFRLLITRQAAVVVSSILHEKNHILRRRCHLNQKNDTKTISIKSILIKRISII